MIKTIIFDCFGVLVTEAWDPFCRKHFRNQPQKLKSAHELGRKLNIGEINYEQFLKSAAELAGIKVQDAREFIDDNQPNAELFRYIRSHLKAKYKIGMLSNAGDNWLEELFSSNDLELFDDIVLSYKHGLTKPSSDIYLLAAARLEVKPAECVFIDDLEKHVNGARATGMKAVLYQDFEQMKQELEKLISYAV